MNMNEHELAVALATLMLEGRVIAFRDPKEGKRDEIRFMAKEIVDSGAFQSQYPKINAISVEDVAKENKWDKDVIQEAKEELGLN